MRALLCMFVGIDLALSALSAKPPKSPPSELLNGYTLNGEIPVAEFYVDDTNNGTATHFMFSEKSINALIAGAEKIMKRMETFQISFAQRQLSEVMFYNSFPKEQWIHIAMLKYKSTFLNAKVAVFGSMEPWVEAASISVGASEIVTVEYNHLTYNHSQFTTVSQEDFNTFYSCGGGQVGSFDVAISLSSFDHGEFVLM